jgi:hypothetical protein
MAIFNYTLPSGNQFKLEAPGGTTQLEADTIFYEQVAAGSLVGYQPGQTLSSPATQITKFELSRLDRGTAGVDSNPILAISQGLPVSSSDVTTQSILAAIQSLPIPIGVPNLTQVPLDSPIDEADVVNIKGDDFAPDSIKANGVTALNEYQVQKILAQLAKLVDQPADTITLEKGIGRFGFTCEQLEITGYVKAGTSQRYLLNNPSNFVAVMSSPSVWTGKNGVYSLADLLNSAVLQNRIQVQLMQQGYEALLASGVIATVPQPSIRLSTGQVYTNSGLQSVQALTAANLVGRNAGLAAGLIQNSQTASTALNRLLSASNTNLATIGSGAVNSLTAGLGKLGGLANANINSITAGLTKNITGGVGALVANAGKFGSQATALWASSGGLQGLANISGVGLNRLTSSLSGASLNSITSSLTNLVPGNLGNLTSNLNVFGKAGSFATNFANPLGSLNNLGNIGNLGSLIPGGGIGGALQGQATAALGNLQGQATAALGSLQGQIGSLANIGSLGSLFGGGGDLVAGVTAAGGFNNTVNRATVDAAFARVVGSAKVPLPAFQYPSPTAQGPRLDIQQAQNFLQNIQGQAQSAAGQATSAARRLLG